MKVYRATREPYTQLQYLHNPSGDIGRWNEQGENALYCGQCQENVLAEFAHYKIIKQLLKLRSGYGANNKIPNIANAICSGEAGVLITFNVTNGPIQDLSADPVLRQFCVANAVPVLTKTDYLQEAFYLNASRKLIIKNMNSSGSNVFIVASARSNICNNIILQTDKFNVGDFSGVTKHDFTAYPVKNSKRITNLQKGFDLGEVLIEFAVGGATIIKVL